MQQIKKQTCPKDQYCFYEIFCFLVKTAILGAILLFLAWFASLVTAWIVSIINFFGFLESSDDATLYFEFN